MTQECYRRPIAVDLFAGIGGFSLGFEQAGFDIAVAVEYDPVHAAVHAYNAPHTRVICADLSAMPSAQIASAVMESPHIAGRTSAGAMVDIDVIFGGPPCQGFSTMGKRLIDDTRNQLVFHFFRVIRDLRPKYFVMENVPGMNAGGHSGILQQLIREFQEEGYQVVPPRILNAAQFGVPQDRRRLFLLGAREGQPLPIHPAARVCPVPKRTAAASASMIRSEALTDGTPIGPTVWEAIGDIPDLDAFDELLSSDEIALPAAILAAQESAASRYARVLRNSEADVDDYASPRRWDRGRLTNSLRTVHTALSIARFADTAPGSTEPISRFYRLDAGGLANTLRAGTGSERGAYTSPRPIHPLLPRVISVREAARLHSFPDWFRLHHTKWHGFRQIGNAVPPLLGRAIATEIRKVLRVWPVKPPQPISLGDPSLLYVDMAEATRLFGVSKQAIPQPRTRRVKKEAS
ncbi:DNA cytosine methyltransferase [Oscillochloris sp. ZM17-4]|uniref:DNA cytosine methyltransferase n=1 Tax=Oscillochloris sp. ZM17-4 TaxID=2866714 RepID=UPI001C73A118|nr:DNA cytosine methyltransferase [Oscillochloris sp. ZM17-4]MBX0330666.1 DNA cytosine methyltransferase [Oscillochloris sp. ZM17-4]